MYARMHARMYDMSVCLHVRMYDMYVCLHVRMYDMYLCLDVRMYVGLCQGSSTQAHSVYKQTTLKNGRSLQDLFITELPLCVSRSTACITLPSKPRSVQRQSINILF